VARLTTGGSVPFNLDTFDIGRSLLADPGFVSATGGSYSRGGEVFSLFSFSNSLTYDARLLPTGGTVQRILLFAGANIFEITDVAVSATALTGWALAGDTEAMKQTVFAGADTFTGSDQDELLRSYGGDDTLVGAGGRDTLDGGLGNDTVSGGAGNDSLVEGGGTNYLRGDDGNDTIVGGGGFDDINGNMGDDSCVSGGGDDWVVGGKDNDTLAGSAGNNLVYGNLGNDSCEGGAGNDILRGGQQDDVLAGGAGDDYVSGDRDNDTVSGGAGADTFHSFGEAGLDRVLDFNRAEGDRVLLDPGTIYTVAQMGADTVISMGGGGQMVLVGVSMASLTDGWIVVG
jgi:Ca2+-binding RTX toxin-like protein